MRFAEKRTQERWRNAVQRDHQIVNGQVLRSPFSVSTAVADIPYDGIAISANGATPGTGIVWKTTGDHTKTPLRRTLHAFDANDLTNEFWNSDMVPARDALGNFALKRERGHCSRNSAGYD